MTKEKQLTRLKKGTNDLLKGRDNPATNINEEMWDRGIEHHLKIRNKLLFILLFLSTITAARTFDIEPNDSIGDAKGPLVTGTTYYGYISYKPSPGDIDFYYFFHRSTITLIYIWLAPPPRVYTYNFYLYNSYGVKVATVTSLLGPAPEYAVSPITLRYIPTIDEITIGRFYVEIRGSREDVYTDEVPYYLSVDYAGGAVEGKVYNADTGLPIANATVEAYDEQKKEVIRIVKTDHLGKYHMVLMEGCTYTITATADGFISESSTGVVIGLAEVKKIDFSLQEYTSDRAVELTMPDAQLVLYLVTDSKVDLNSVLLNKPDAKMVSIFAVWESSVTNYYSRFSTWTSTQDKPPDLKLKFALTSSGDFYIGVVPRDVPAGPLSVLTFGGIGYEGPLSQELSMKQNLLMTAAKFEWIDLKLKGCISAGPENTNEFLNLSTYGLLNKYSKPIYILFSAVAHAQEEKTRFSELIHPKFSPVITTNGTLNLSRTFKLVYYSTINSYITLTCFSDDKNYSSATINSTTILQTNYGGSVETCIDTYPTNISLFCHSTNRKVYSKIHAAFIADSITPINWTETPFNKNPKPLVLKLNPGWNYSAEFSKLMGKITLGDLSPLGKNVKLELLSNGVVKRTITDLNGYYVITSTPGIYDIIISSHPEYSTKKVRNVEIPIGLKNLDFTLNELLPINITVKTSTPTDSSYYHFRGTVTISADKVFKFESDGYYHAIAFTTYTFNRLDGEHIFEIELKSQGFGLSGFGLGNIEGIGDKSFADIKYGVLIQDNSRHYIISGEKVYSDNLPSFDYIPYKLSWKKTGGGTIVTVSTVTYGMETTINNLPFIIFGSTTSYARNMKITLYEELKLSTGVVYGKITKSDGYFPIEGATVTVTHISGSSQTYVTGHTGRYYIAIDIGTCTIKVRHDGYLPQTRDIEILSGEKIIMNFALDEKPAFPDLIIKSLIPNTTAPSFGDTVNIEITIKNIGDTAATNFYVDFYKNLISSPTISQPGDVCWLVGSLLPGKEKIFVYGFKYTEGPLNSYAQIDTANSVKEKNETNNIIGPIIIGKKVETAKLSGTVISEYDGKPIKNAEIKISSVTMGEILKTLKTDTLGCYSTELEKNNSYYLHVTATDFLPSTTTIFLTEDMVYHFKLVYVPPHGAVYGTVTNELNLPIPLARIDIASDIDREIINVQPNGFYRIIKTPREYSIRATAPGYNTETKTIVISPNSATLANFNLKLSSPIPLAVRNFLAEPMENLRMKLKWTTSPSTGIARYNIYYTIGASDDFDYFLLYSTTRAFIQAAEQRYDYTYITEPLSRGKLYNFSVRPVDVNGIENNETCAVIQSMPVDRRTGTKFIIASPETAQRLYGDIFTIYAEPLWGSDTSVEVRFEYKLPYTGGWKLMYFTERNPNPDLRAPYFIHFSTNLNIGDYQIRAVEKTDYAPIVFTITISTINYQTYETKNLKETILYNTINNKIIFASIDEDKITSIEIPARSIPTQSEFLTILKPDSVPVNLEYFQLHKIRELKLGNIQETLKPYSLRIPYEDDNNDDLIDGTVSKAEYLKVVYFESERYYHFKNFTVNKENKSTDINSNRMTTFAVFVPSAFEDFKDVVIYPNPFRAPEHKTIKFKGLTKDVTIKIFNIAGELINELHTPGAFYEWDVKNKNDAPVTSGVYLYLLKDKAGNIGKGKFVIIR